MRQYTLFTDSLEELTDFVRGLRLESAYRYANDRFLLICDQETDAAVLQAKVTLLRGMMPDIQIMG